MLLRQTGLYTIANIFAAAAGFASVVVFTRLLSPSQYGVYIVILGLTAILNVGMFSWIRISTMRFQSEGNHRDVRNVALTGYLVTLFLLPVLVLVLHFGFGVPWERASCAAFLAGTVAMFELTQEVLRARLQASRSLTMTVSRSVSAFVFMLCAVAAGGGGIGLAFGAATAYILAVLSHHQAAWGLPREPFAKSIFRQFLAYGLPLTAASLIFIVHSNVDRLSIAWIIGDDAAGRYGSTADLVRQMITLPTASVSYAALPMAIRALATEGPEAASLGMANGIELFLGLLLPAGVGLALISDHFVAVAMGPQFRDTASMLSPFLCCAAVLAGITQLYVHQSFHLAMKPHLIIAQGLATLALSLLITPYLVYQYNVMGGAYGVVIVECLGLLLGIWLSRFAFPLPFPPGRLLRVVFSTASMAVAVFLVKPLLPNASATSVAVLIAVGLATYGFVALALDVGGVRGVLLRALSRLRAQA